MLGDVLAGLRATPKFLPSAYLYDARGAELFERICDQPEYYLTRTEVGILRSNMEAIAAAVGPGALVVEPGSGDGRKSTQLLEGLTEPAGYVPIDISREQLVTVAARMNERFPDVEVIPVCADFNDDPPLPHAARGARRNLVFFPGSTIGNLEPDRAVEVLVHLRTLAGPGGRILIGVDRRKDRARLEAAYDDAAGLSRAFAMNYLRRLNEELDADFDLNAFDYAAPWDERSGRIEMALVSLADQEVRIAGNPVTLEQGERIRTEYSCKYEPEEFARLAGRAGLGVTHRWSDPEALFSVVLLAHHDRS